MKYKRLTKRNEHGEARLAIPLKGQYIRELDEEAGKRDAAVLRRLCELEDKIEQGTLIELPCKVGDTIYVVPHIWDRKGIFVGEIDKRKADAFYVIGDIVDIEDDILGEFYRMGEEVFLTREKAEKRLKELQNGF